MSDYRECVHIKADCIHKNCKCSECPMCDLICDEFYDCVDSAIANAKKETINGIMALIDKACESYDSLSQVDYDRCYQQGRADKLSEICKQISERVEYWDSCAKAMEKGSNEYKIFISLAKNFDELSEQLKEQ